MLQHPYLYWQWLKRDIAGRYRGSLLGLLWPVLQPITQILVFTLIFFEFMKMRWPGVGINGTALGYGLNVFAGLAVFNYFSEILGRAPASVLSQPNLVTKVKFPLMLLPSVTVGAALVHIVVGAGVLILVAVATGQLHWGMLSLPLYLLPLYFYGLALSWLLAGLGVYLRDISQIMPALASMLMFLTPIFYPATFVPDRLRPWFELNPIGWGAQALRAILLESTQPAGGTLLGHAGASIALAVMARWVFKRLEKGFSDVL